uniref:Anaphase-promoting complex subunit 4 WD40 domain-containing protein n=1 Tax=Aureoumbra lagunensis TaxID=44058 RepID=A0A7S3JUY0_9STRA
MDDPSLALECLLSVEEIPKNVKWSPDGTCLLTATEKKRLLLMELPNSVIESLQKKSGRIANGSPPVVWKSILEYAEAESIRDYAWYPGMNSNDTATCCFVSCARDQPLHLWDAYTGNLRASYAAWKTTDEIDGAVSLAFSQDGTKLYTGSESAVRLFYTAEPGKNCFVRKTRSKRQSKDGQHGLIGALATWGHYLYAAGSYKGSVGLYDDRIDPEQGAVLLFPSQLFKSHGVTALQFNSSGFCLFVGTRAERPQAYIRIFDLRRIDDFEQECLRLPRQAGSNQRLGFHLFHDDHTFATATDNKGVALFHLDNFDFKISSHVQAKEHDVVNGCHFHPQLPLLATALGQHRFLQHKYDIFPRNALHVWHIPPSSYFSSPRTASSISI